MSTGRRTHRHGSQQTERLGEAGPPEAGGCCRTCSEGMLPSVMGRRTYGSSIVLSVSCPKIDRAAGG